MLALPPTPVSLSHAQLLGLITTPDPQAGIDGGSLTVTCKDPTALVAVPAPQMLETLEDRVVGLLAPRIPSGESPRVLLFGPGTSRTDPLYALRFLAKLTSLTGRAGKLEIYDLRNDPLIPSYYRAIPWNGHAVSLALGGEGNFETLRDADAHLILAIHTSVGPDRLFASFSNNLVRGGIAVTQSSVLDPDPDQYELLMETIEETHAESLKFLHPPIRSRVFHSYFADRSEDVHAMVLERV